MKTKPGKKSRSNQVGATLIELLLYLALLTIIATIATDILFSSGEFSLEASSKNILQEDGRYIMNRLTFDIHRATTITTPASFGGSGTNSLQLDLTIGFSPTETHVYSLAGNYISFQGSVGVSLQPANLNSNQTKITNLKFIRLGTVTGKPTVKISFDLESVKPLKQGINKQSFETLVGTR